MIIIFQVNHECPQCGAPITLGEADRFFVCPYCRVHSCISQKKYYRYLLSPPNENTDTADMIYIPYWRFKGTTFHCSLENGVDHRFVDTSRLALTPPLPDDLPHSLGIRSQALPLKLVSEKCRGRFLTPTGLKAALAEFDRQFDHDLRRRVAIIFKEHIGEMISLIYSPVYIRGRTLYDGLLNRPMNTSLTGDFGLETLDSFRPEKETIFISGLCPDCGWNLTGNAESLALVCRNCHTLWRSHKNRLAKIRYGCVPGPADALLPFWRVEADISGIPLASYADLVPLANLPRAVQPGWDEKPLAFWAPAFKIRPNIFLRLSRRLIISQPDFVLSETIDKRPLYPVTLPPTEAVESIKVNLADIMKPERLWMPRLPDITVTPQQITLIFLPFKERHHDLHAPEIQISINKNVLAHAANL